MPRELLMQNNYEWVTAEGQTLEIENAIRSNARGLKIDGKTYQNLLSEVKYFGKFVYDESTGEYTLNAPVVGVWNAMNISYTRPIQEGEKLLIRINIVKNTIETTGSPAIKITFSNGNRISKGYVGVNNGFTGLLEHYCDGASINETDKNRIHISTNFYSSGELIIKDIQVIPVSENLLLNNIKLPTSINGIESVAEREKEGNLYPVKIAQSNNETDGIVLPNGVKNTIENGKHIKRIGKLILDGSRNYTRHSTLSFNDMSLFYFANPNINKTSHIGISSKLPCYDITERVNCIHQQKECIILSDGSTGLMQIILKNTSLETQDVAGLKAYLRNDPITLYHELATPITESLTTTEIPLPQPLRSLPNGVCDEVVGNKLIQNIYELKLDSSFNFNQTIPVTIGNVPSDTTLCRFNITTLSNPIVLGNNNSVTSNMFPYLYIHHLPGGSIAVRQECVSNHSADKYMINIVIKKSRLSSVSVDGFKEWCIANNFKILYQLETPIEHTINVPRVSIAKGTNMVTTANNVTPNLSIKYKKAKK